MYIQVFECEHRIVCTMSVKRTLPTFTKSLIGFESVRCYVYECVAYWMMNAMKNMQPGTGKKPGFAYLKILWPQSVLFKVSPIGRIGLCLYRQVFAICGLPWSLANSETATIQNRCCRNFP